ncbi:hypothetical protein BO78DRAFT_452704 [Aspergillus sclerotiicarbonarius CBS 121057]|uniref:Membrane fusion mating protein FIG1 n=1 Tax=Aspergillus sclerotiicarbonarius (strain CBS 121057 / IBT 28362) TaxID=1448318 RepID=A0A319DZ02_ASPSB|nr:hypothetical protein BO78DRAFT_452704 [Aspergillus sclerotiicarbonarius CBS 121057]
MFMMAVAVILLSILLAGCTSSNGVGNIYLLSLEYTTTSPSIKMGSAQVSSLIVQAVHNVSHTGNGTALEVRAGYRGLCMTHGDSERVCSPSARVLASLLRAEEVTTSSGETITPDPLNLVMIANDFREKIVFDGILFIVIALCAICLLLLSTIPGFHDNGHGVEEAPFPQRPAVIGAVLAGWFAFGFSLVSILWQHINSGSTASMTGILTYGTVSGHVGGAAMALGWIAVALLGIVALGLYVMNAAIELLRGLVSDVQPLNREDGDSDETGYL